MYHRVTTPAVIVEAYGIFMEQGMVEDAFSGNAVSDSSFFEFLQN